MPLALFSILQRTQLVGHNAKGDATHLRKDFNLTLKEPFCTMAFAKKLFGPRESLGIPTASGVSIHSPST